MQREKMRIDAVFSIDTRNGYDRLMLFITNEGHNAMTAYLVSASTAYFALGLFAIVLAALIVLAAWAQDEVERIRHARRIRRRGDLARARIAARFGTSVLR